MAQRKRWGPPVGFLLWVLLLAGRQNAWSQISPTEYQIKAVFLFNFSQFIQWPSDTFTRADQPFCIGILGEDPFGAFLDETVKGEKINGHPLVVERYKDAQKVENCQILFISRSKRKQMKKILAALRGQSVLTVGDANDFIEEGGIIRFVTENDKIHFQIDLALAQKSHLTISSQMLELAEIVQPRRN